MSRVPAIRPLAQLRAVLPRGRELAPEVFRSRHRAVLWILVGHVVAIFVFGVARGYGAGHSLIEAAVVAALTLLAAEPRFSRKIRGALAAAGLVTSSAILVHLSGGSIEVHFHFFVVLGLMTVYQDWLPYGVAFAYVVVHHGVFGVLDPESVYEHVSGRQNPWLWAGIHGGFVLAAAVVQIYSWRVNEMEHARAEGFRLQLLEGRMRKKQALQINDAVVQGLVVAKMAASLGERERADAALDTALARARAIISDLLGEAARNGRVAPGDLVRDSAASHDDHDHATDDGVGGPLEAHA
jgi:hypothetical protein